MTTAGPSWPPTAVPESWSARTSIPTCPRRTQDGDLLRYSEAHVRAMIVSATDARSGWPEPKIRSTEGGQRAALYRPRRRRMYL